VRDILESVIIECIAVGSMFSNCYLLGDTETREGAVIDPGDDYERIKERVDKHNLQIKFIINTHGHIDHIGANKRFAVPVWIHREDATFLSDPAKNLSLFFGLPFSSSGEVQILKDDDTISMGEIKFKVIHTPGHTPGGICLYYADGNCIFTGDTLFADGLGRTDFPYASEDTLLKSIKERLLTLPGETVVYPGHGPSSTIGRERGRYV